MITFLLICAHITLTLSIMFWFFSRIDERARREGREQALIDVWLALHRMANEASGAKENASNPVHVSYYEGAEETLQSFARAISTLTSTPLIAEADLKKSKKTK